MKSTYHHLLLTITVIIVLLSHVTEGKRVRNLNLFGFDPWDFLLEVGEVAQLVSNLDKGKGSHFGDHLYAENKHRKTPVVQSVVVAMFGNIADFFSRPSWGHFAAIYVDLSSFVVIPMQGGYHAPLAHTKYVLDLYAYREAGVTEIYLFKALSNVFKDFYW